MIKNKQDFFLRRCLKSIFRPELSTNSRGSKGLKPLVSVDRWSKHCINFGFSDILWEDSEWLVLPVFVMNYDPRDHKWLMIWAMIALNFMILRKLLKTFDGLYSLEKSYFQQFLSQLIELGSWSPIAVWANASLPVNSRSIDPALDLKVPKFPDR
jgi:hypothetical protein